MRDAESDLLAMDYAFLDLRNLDHYGATAGSFVCTTSALVLTHVTDMIVAGSEPTHHRLEVFPERDGMR